MCGKFGETFLSIERSGACVIDIHNSDFITYEDDYVGKPKVDFKTPNVIIRFRGKWGKRSHHTLKLYINAKGQEWLH